MTSSLGRCVVTGAAGFIGSNLCDYLLSRGYEVIGIDNFSTGRKEFLTEAAPSERFTMIKADLFDPEAARSAIADSEAHMLIHLAANADVRFGLLHPRLDLEQGTMVTQNVLEGARLGGIETVAFASSGSVYGEPELFPTPENCPFPIQTSLYAAAKVGGEALFQAYAHGFGMRAVIFRFVSILGPRYSHGHVRDFVAKLLSNPREIEILGDGNQTKSYVHVVDCVAAIAKAIEHTSSGVSVFNVGTQEAITVNQSLEIICSEMGLSPERRYTGGKRGWIGDSPFILLDCSKMQSLGWTPTLSVLDGIRATVRYLMNNRWLLDRGEN